MGRTRNQVLAELYEILNAALFMEETRWLNPSTNKIEIRNPDIRSLRVEMIKAIEEDNRPIDKLVQLVNRVNDRIQRYDTPKRIKDLVDELIVLSACSTPNEVHDTRRPS